MIGGEIGPMQLSVGGRQVDGRVQLTVRNRQKNRKLDLWNSSYGSRKRMMKWKMHVQYVVEHLSTAITSVSLINFNVKS